MFDRPDRWDNLPEKVASLPGIYSNLMTFSAGPRVRFIHSSRTNAKEANMCIPLVGMYWNALLYHRNEELPIHPSNKLCILAY